MLHKAWRIVSAHGPLELARRVTARLRSRLQASVERRRRHTAARRALQSIRVPAGVSFTADDRMPLVSIVVPCYNAWRYTNACLRALSDTWDSDIATEVIVVDDASTDQTATLLGLCAGIRVVLRDENGGFVAAANDGARAARGRYVHFLNNDAIVTQGWLQALLDCFESQEKVGAVVSQLRFADDTVAEAGAVVWRDGQGSNYGRGDAPDAPAYEYVREVDYGSAASLLVLREAFDRAGGFSPDFAPAYYEDVDLCFTLRACGYRVLYQPRSVVYHVEGISYGSNVRRDATALQEANRERFACKWAERLGDALPPDPASIEPAARRLQGRAIALVVDEHVPLPDRDAGSARMAFIVEALRRRGYHVIFASIEASPYGSYAERLRQGGVEVILGFSPASIASLKAQRLCVEIAWLVRPEPCATMLPYVRGVFPEAKIAFDTVDVHYLRLQREARETGRTTSWAAVRSRELANAAGADATIVTSPVEKQLLEEQGVRSVCVVTVPQPAITPSPRGFADRSGIAFVGNYAHQPNIDAAAWLCSEIMPQVLKTHPDVVLTLAGADPPLAVRRLAGENIEVPGYVDDIDSLLDSSRVFVAPLRYGAGIKGKILRALAVGIPVVTTPIGAEGIFEDRELPLAVTAVEITARIVELYDDAIRWEASACAGVAIAAQFAPAQVDAQFGRALVLLRKGSSM